MSDLLLDRRRMMQSGGGGTVTALRIYGNAYFVGGNNFNILLGAYKVGFRRIAGTGYIMGGVIGSWGVGGLSNGSWKTGYSNYFTNKIIPSDSVYEIVHNGSGKMEYLFLDGDIIDSYSPGATSYFGSWYVNALSTNTNGRNSSSSINDIIYIKTSAGKLLPYDNNGVAALLNEQSGDIITPIVGNGRTELIEIPINFELQI